MKLFHALMGGAEAPALRLSADSSKNILLSASMLCFDSRWKKYLSFIHKKKRQLFADSGLIGWLKSEKYGFSAFEEYAQRPERILSIQAQIDPDIYASVDVPCARSILNRSGITVELALAQTVANARWLKSLPLPGKIKCFAVQGDKPEEYLYCIDEYRRLGLFDCDPANTWFAVGSVCMRKPPELYSLVKLVRERIPTEFHVHCFGIGNPMRVLNLAELGINSCDSATAGIEAGLKYSWIDEGGRCRSLTMRKRNRNMFYAMAAFNMESLEYQISQGTPSSPVQLLDLIEWEQEP